MLVRRPGTLGILSCIPFTVLQVSQLVVLLRREAHCPSFYILCIEILETFNQVQPEFCELAAHGLA